MVDDPGVSVVFRRARVLPMVVDTRRHEQGLEQYGRLQR